MSVSERLLIAVMLVWGTTNIVSGSKLTRPLRDRLQESNARLGELANCYMCTGFWIGCLWSVLGFGIAKSIAPVWIGVIADGFMMSGSTWIIHVVLEKLGASEL